MYSFNEKIISKRQERENKRKEEQQIAEMEVQEYGKRRNETEKGVRELSENEV